MNKVSQAFKQLGERIKENFKDSKVLLLIVSLLWVILIVVTLTVYAPTLGKLSVGNEISDYIVELNEDTSIEEIIPVNTEITSDEDITIAVKDADSISIKFATYARNNSGSINISVVGDVSGIDYVNKTINVNKINDNSYYTVSFSKDIDAKDKNLIITMSSTSPVDKGVGVYFSNDKFFGTSSLKISGVEQSGDLTLKCLTHSDELYQFYLSAITWAIVGISLIIFLIILVKPKYEILFPIIIFILGLIFMAIIVPLAPPDEQVHYEYSLQLSNILMGDNDYTFVNKAYVYYGHLTGHYNVSGGYIRFMEDISKPLELSSKTVQTAGDITDMFICAYLPQALGITLCRIFGLNMLRTFYAGRLFNLIFYCLCVYLAIKVTPVNKFLFGFVYALPMFIQTAMSYSYDNFVICLSLLLFAYFLKWRFTDEKIKPIEYIFVLLICIGLSKVKYVYGFLAFAFMFVPKTRFKNVWVKWALVILLIIGGSNSMIPIIVSRITQNVGNINNTDLPSIDEYADDSNSSDTVNVEDSTYEVTDQSVTNEATTENSEETTSEVASTSESETETTGSNIKNVKDSMVDDENWDGEERFPSWYIFAHPLDTAKIFLRTIRYYIKSWFYSAIGRSLAGETLILPLTMVHLVLGLVVLASLREEEIVPPIPLKCMYVLGCCGIGLLIMMGMFLSWTTYNQTIIDDFGGIVVQGVQGRYFCPILIFFLAIFNNNKIKVPKKFDNYILLTYIFIFFEIIVYVLSYTFVN